MNLMVLNLIINGLPSIQEEAKKYQDKVLNIVLNLIINGLPSILMDDMIDKKETILSFKPYYKWITFNTAKYALAAVAVAAGVLNLIINGLPSIPPRPVCANALTLLRF